MQEPQSAVPSAPYKDFTGGALVKGYGAALAGAERGDAEAPAAIDYFSQRLNEIAMRDDDFGLAARQTRASFSQYMAARAEGQPSRLDDFINRDALKSLDQYLVDGGDFESKRRYDLNGASPQPAYMGFDGKVYVDAAGVAHEIPLDWARKHRESIVSGYRGEMVNPADGGQFLASASAAVGPEGMSVVAKAADYATRATRMAIEGKDWDQLAPLMDVPTADPMMPFPVLPNRLTDENGEELSPEETQQILKNPVYLRAIKELFAEEQANGTLDKGLWDNFVRTTGFLADFAAVSGAGSALVKGLGAGARATGLMAQAPVAELAAQTAAAAEGATIGVRGGLMARPAIQAGMSTVRQFVGYQITNDAIYGRIQTPSDVASSGLAGAKDASLVLGASWVMGAVRAGIFGALAKKVQSPATQEMVYRYGPVGRAVGAIYDTARNTDSMGTLTGKMVSASTRGEALRRNLAAAGWDKNRAQMVEHMIDSAGVGLMFGAYHSASAKPGWDTMAPGEKLAELANGLSSPEALGGAAAFATSVMAQAYANRVKWGQEWENAPPQVRETFEADLKNVIHDIANPTNLETLDAYRQAFDAYRAANPKDFEGIEFTTPQQRAMKLAVEAAVAEGTAQRMSDAPPPGEQPPPAAAGEAPPTPPAGPAPAAPQAPERAPALDGGYEAWRQARIDAGEKPEALDAPTKNGRSTEGYYRFAAERRAALKPKPKTEGELQFPEPEERVTLEQALELMPYSRADELKRLVVDGYMRAWRDGKGGMVFDAAEVRRMNAELLGMGEAAPAAEAPQAAPETAPTAPPADASVRNDAELRGMFSGLLEMEAQAQKLSAQKRESAPGEAPTETGFEPPPGITQEEWLSMIEGELSQFAPDQQAPARQKPAIGGEGADLMRSIERSSELERVKATDLVLAPEEMQYKSGTDPKTGRDPEGPLAKLKDRKEWSEPSAGFILVYERAGGERVVVDGHQRVNAAKRLSKDGGAPIELNAFVVRESDGVTVPQARALGAVMNTRSGTGKAVDIAKVIRDLGWTPDQLEALGARGAFAQQAVGLSQLADPVFALVTNEQIQANYAAEIGRHIPKDKPDLQLATAKMIQRTARSVDMAESIARQASQESLVSSGEMDLFGGAGDVKTTLELRAEILAEIMPEMRQVGRAMQALARNADAAKREGVGEIDAAKAEALAKDSKALSSAIADRAGKKGTEVNDVLSRAAEQLGKNPEQLRRISADALRELEALAQAGRIFEDVGTRPQANAQSGPALFSGAGGKAQGKFRFKRGEAASIHPATELKPLTRAEAEIYLRGASHVLFPTTAERNERVKGVAQTLVGIGVPAAEAETTALLMDAHATVWAAKLGKSPEAWYAEKIAGVTKDAPPGGAPPEAVAAATFIEDGRAILHAMKGQDFATITEELFHVWRRDLKGAELEAVAKWAGVFNNRWTVQAEEKFAGAALRYLRTGQAPSRETQGIFAQAKKFLTEIFQRIRGTGLDVTLPSDVRRSIDSLFKLTGEGSDQVVAERMARLGPEQMGDIYRQNRNRPQYLGMSLEEVVGHELRGGLPDPKSVSIHERIAQAGDSAREAYDIMRMHGALEPLPYTHPNVARAILDAAAGGTPQMRQRFGRFGQPGATALNAAVESARRALSQMRAVAVDSASADVKRERIASAVEVAEWLSKSEPIPADVQMRAKKAGLIRANGRVDRLMMVASAKHIENQFAIASVRAGMSERLAPLVATAQPWMAFGIAPHEITEHALARNVKLRRLVDWNKQHGLVPPSVMRQLEKIGSAVGGMWQNVPSTSVNLATNKAAALHVFQKWERAVKTLQGRGDEAIARIVSKFNGRIPPRSHMKLLNEAIELGLVAKMKGPEGFEKLQSGTGYLFEIAIEINDVLSSLGQLGVQSRFFAPEQIEKWGGRYRPHLYLSAEREEWVAQLRDGKPATAFAGRSLSRGYAHDRESQLAIEDPFSWLTAVTRQEGKAAQMLGVVLDLHGGKYAITEAELKSLDPYDANAYVPFALNPKSLGNSPGLGNGPALRNWYFLADILEKQLDPADRRPKSAALTKALQELTGIEFKDGHLHSTKPSMYVTRQVLWELDTLTSQMFNPPVLDGKMDRAVHEFEQATRAFRRGLTVGRPKHWVLNILNSVGTSHVLDRLPMWDSISSFTAGRGYYADSVRDILGLVELSKLPDQKVKPEGWTNEKWERVQLLQEAFAELNGTTFTGVGAEASVVTDALASAITPDMRTTAMLEDLAAQGHEPESAAARRSIIFDTGRRVSGGMAEFDRRLARMMGSHDAAERARALANFTSFYNLWEMTFKWAAALRTIETQPDATSYSLKDIVRWAAVGTADYANTSPILRSFNTSYSVLSNPLYVKSDGNARWARAAMREMFKGRFWMYMSTMQPALMASVASHPLRAATIGALTAGVTGALHALSTSDPEEDAAWQEAVRGSVARAGEPLIDKETLDIYERMNLPAPNVSGIGALTPEDPSMVRDLWLAMLRGRTLTFQAPNRGDQTRMSSLADIAPGWGNWIGAGESAGKVIGGTPSMAVDTVFDTLSMRGMELTQAVAFGLIHGARLIDPDTQGRGAMLTKMLAQTAADVFPTISPFFLASRDGQRMVEVSALNGQTIDEWARGVLQVDKPSDLANVGEFAFSSLWRSQRLVQPSSGGLSERDAMDSLLRRIVPGSSPSQGPFWDKQRHAQREIHYQLAEILSGTYEEYLKWGRSQGSYDALLVPELFGQQGAMHRRIASEQDPEVQQAMSSYLERFITSKDWNEVLGQTLELARRRAMRPDYFRAALSNSITDPDGTGLVNWLDKKVVRGKPTREELNDYAALFYNAVRVPGPDAAAAQQQYRQIDERLRAAGYSAAYTLEAPSEILRRRGIKPELAGRPALNDAILNR